MQADVVFISPPWGGPSYSAKGGIFAVEPDIGGLGMGLRGLVQVS